MVTKPAPELFDEDAAAAHIGMSTAFLRAGRCRGVVGNGTPPPPHLKLGRAVKYARADLDMWLAERRSRVPGATVARSPSRRPFPVSVSADHFNELANMLVQAIVAELRKQTGAKPPDQLG